MTAPVSKLHRRRILQRISPNSDFTTTRNLLAPFKEELLSIYLENKNLDNWIGTLIPQAAGKKYRMFQAVSAQATTDSYVLADALNSSLDMIHTMALYFELERIVQELNLYMDSSAQAQELPVLTELKASIVDACSDLQTGFQVNRPSATKKAMHETTRQAFTKACNSEAITGQTRSFLQKLWQGFLNIFNLRTNWKKQTVENSQHPVLQGLMREAMQEGVSSSPSSTPSISH